VILACTVKAQGGVTDTQTEGYRGKPTDGRLGYS